MTLVRLQDLHLPVSGRLSSVDLSYACMKLSIRCDHSDLLTCSMKRCCVTESIDIPWDAVIRPDDDSESKSDSKPADLGQFGGSNVDDKTGILTSVGGTTGVGDVPANQQQALLKNLLIPQQQKWSQQSSQDMTEVI